MASPELDDRIPSVRWKRNLITAFILFTMVAVGVGAPRPLPTGNAIASALLYTTYYLRIFQRWELFYPEPRRTANYYRFDITFKNGKGVWRRTAPVNWDFFRRHEAYNFQKFDLAGEQLDVPSQVWRDLAAYIARKYNTDPANPMISMQFVKSTAEWPPPNETGWVGGEEKDLVWHDRILFTYEVERKELIH